MSNPLGIPAGVDTTTRKFNPDTSGGRYVPDSDPSWYVGEVEDVFPETHSMRVRLDISGGQERVIEAMALAKCYDPVSHSKEIILHKRGTPVFVTRAPGFWIVVGVAVSPMRSYLRENGDGEAYQRTQTPEHKTVGNHFGGHDPLYIKQGSVNYRGQGPRDVMAGDWSQTGSEGNSVGILEGGVSVLRGGALSQLIMSKLGDVVKFMAHDFNLFTKCGTFRTTQALGSEKVGLELSGYFLARDAQDPNNSKEPDYRITLGGDRNLFAATIGRNLDGTPKYAYMVDNTGKGWQVRAGYKNMFTAGSTDSWVERDGDDTTISTGNYTHHMLNRTLRINGKYNLTAKSLIEQYVKKNTKISTLAEVVEDRDTVYGPSLTPGAVVDKTTIVGKRSVSFLPDTSGPSTDTTSLKSGDHIIEILGKGNITRDIKGVGDFNYSTLKGNFNLSTLLGEINMTAGPSSAPTSGRIYADKSGKVALGSKFKNPTTSCRSDVVHLMAMMCDTMAKFTKEMVKFETTPAANGAPCKTGPLLIPKFTEFATKWKALKVQIDAMKG